MASHTLRNSDQLLQQLHHGRLAFERAKAAEQLGQLTASEEHVVGALLASQAADSAPVVRQAAAQALKAGAHQTLLARHAAGVDAIAARLRPALEQRQQAAAESILQDFARRRQRELISTAAFALIVMVWLASMLLQMAALVQLGYVLVTGMLAITFIFSRFNWRCPACNVSLSGRNTNVGAVFCPSPLPCPHCGTRLR